MKNKYLVLFFFATLLVGLAIRQAPWKREISVQVQVIRLDTALITQINVLNTSGIEWSFLKSDQHWAIEQNGRSVSVPLAGMDTLLRALAPVRSLSIAPSGSNIDSVFKQNALKCRVWCGGRVEEHFELALLNDNRAFLRISGQQEVVYVIAANLFRLLSKDLSSYRLVQAFSFPSDRVEGLRILQKDTLLFEWTKRDTAGFDAPQRLAAAALKDSITVWCDTLHQLSKGSFADFFDESILKKRLFMEIYLTIQQQSEPIHLRIIRFQSADMPEDLSALRRPEDLPVLVLHSSQNPNNYFSIKDTVLINTLLNMIARIKQF